jgi:hypothetical protein
MMSCAPHTARRVGRVPAALGLSACETTASYSGFNMSLAEESLIDIFRRLYAAPTGALVIIEDIS